MRGYSERILDFESKLKPVDVEWFSKFYNILEEKRRKKGEIISFSTSNPKDFKMPSSAKKAAVRAIQTGNKHHYVFDLFDPGFMLGDIEVRKAIVDKLRRENGINAELGEVAVTPGIQYAYFMLLMAIVNPGDDVLIIEPDYEFDASVILVGGNVKRVPLRKDAARGKWSFDPEDLRKRATSKTKLLMFSNPNNPVGIVYTKENLETIAQIAEENDFYIFSDELYERLVFDGRKHISISSLSPGLKERTVTAIGPSKFEAMAGFRIGYIHAGEDLMRKMGVVLINTVQQAPHVGQMALLALLRGTKEVKEEITKLLARYQENRDQIVKRLNEIDDVICNNPEGSYYVFPDVSAYGPVPQIIEALLRGGIFVHDGTIFGPTLGRGHIRYCFAQSKDHIDIGMDRTAKALTNMRKK